MTQSHIFSFLVSNVVNLLFCIILLEVGLRLSRFCKMARKQNVVGLHWI